LLLACNYCQSGLGHHYVCDRGNPCFYCKRDKKECFYHYPSDPYKDFAERNIEEAKMLLRKEGNTEPHILRSDQDDIHFWRQFADHLLEDNKQLQGILDKLTEQHLKEDIDLNQSD